MKVGYGAALFGAGLCVIAFGCTDIQVLDSTVRPLSLQHAYERVTEEGLRVSFPVGIYTPDFKNKLGSYYRAPDKVMARTNNENRSRIGGIYAPSEADPDQRQGAWFEEQQSSTGEVKIKLAAPTRTYRYSEAVPFSRVEKSAAKSYGASRCTFSFSGHPLNSRCAAGASRSGPTRWRLPGSS